MSKRLFENRKGISNLIATLILIAVAVVGGAFAYTAFRNQAQSTTTNADLQVQSLDAVKVDGTTNLSITVKNVGTQRLTVNSVEIGTDNITSDLSLGSVDPGQTVSGSADSSGGLSVLMAGKKNIVEIIAGTPGGSITKIMTVRVQ